MIYDIEIHIDNPQQLPLHISLDSRMSDTIFVLRLVTITLVSSAQRTVVVSLAALGKSILNRKNDGPKIEPYGTQFLTALSCILSVKYSLMSSIKIKFYQ
jgi:hypothetical protein